MSAKKKPAAKKKTSKRKGSPDASKLATPKHGVGKLLRGGNYGNKGGGRKPDELRARFRDLTAVTLEETIRRVEASRRTVPSREKLERMSKADLIDMLLDIGEWIQLKPGEIRSILDAGAKYGIGTKHVVGGDEDAAPLTIRVVD